MVITTTDSAYTYTLLPGTNNRGAVPSFKIVNNKATSNTQGFQIKTQFGRNRIECELEIMDSDTNIRTSLLPMLEYPSEWEVTFDDIVPLRNTTLLNMALVDYDLDNEFQFVNSDGTGDLRINLKLIEVIGV